MSGYTKTPWTMETVRTSCGVCFKIGPFPWKNGKLNHACIYADYPSPGSSEYKESVANAKLIAAAPDLLEALQAAKFYIIGEALPTKEHALSIIDAAIKKATE